MSLANIMPQEQVEIELRYTELLVPTDNVYEVVFPTVVGPRYASPQDEDEKRRRLRQTPYLRQGQKADQCVAYFDTGFAAGVPIYDLSCPSHQIHAAVAESECRAINSRRFGSVPGKSRLRLRYRLAGDQIASGLLLYQGADENFFLYMAQPPHVSRRKPSRRASTFSLSTFQARWKVFL